MLMDQLLTAELNLFEVVLARCAGRYVLSAFMDKNNWEEDLN